jgi:peptidoglycan hydrolase CwlO-like protein
MTNDTIVQLQLESANNILKIYVDSLVKITKELLYIQRKLDTLSNKKKRSEDEEKQITELQSDLKNGKRDLEETEQRIEIMRTMIEHYEKNKPVEV